MGLGRKFIPQKTCLHLKNKNTNPYKTTILQVKLKLKNKGFHKHIYRRIRETLKTNQSRKLNTSTNDLMLLSKFLAPSLDTASQFIHDGV